MKKILISLMFVGVSLMLFSCDSGKVKIKLQDGQEGGDL